MSETRKKNTAKKAKRAKSHRASDQCGCEGCRVAKEINKSKRPAKVRAWKATINGMVMHGTRPMYYIDGTLAPAGVQVGSPVSITPLPKARPRNDK